MSLKSKDIIITPNNFETKAFRAIQLSPVIVGKKKKSKKETPTLVWEIIRTAVPYTNITKRCSLCLNEKLAILMYPNQSKLLKKRSELVSKCQHENKFLLQMFNSND